MKLVIQNLTKTYKNGVKAIDDLSIEIGKGMFGLLGPNGAGKSSLMRTIATLQTPDSGTITFGDINVLEDKMSLRKVLGYLPQSFGVYPKMSAEDLLDYFATLKGISICDEFFYSLIGENGHYGTPTNLNAPGCVPGGSSSGSAAALTTNLYDFSIGSDK